MKWLTISQIERRSKTAKGALKVSYEHWNQLYTATAKELREKDKRTDRYIILGTSCGLCIYYTFKYDKYEKCNHCPLRQAMNSYRCGHGDDLWTPALHALSDWTGKKCNWHTWKRTCKALRDKLKELIEQGD